MLLEQNRKGPFYPSLERNNLILGNQWLANSQFSLTLEMLNFEITNKQAPPPHTYCTNSHTHTESLTNTVSFAKTLKAGNANKVYNMIREVI